jgi:imidazolonepropionase-like amidohydrolase
LQQNTCQEVGKQHPVFRVRAAAIEFLLAVELGMNHNQALPAGTVIASEALGTGVETGSIEVGKRADLIAMPADPLVCIDVLLTPSFVMKAGQVVRQTPSNGSACAS